MLDKFSDIPVWFTEDHEKLENWLRMGVPVETIARLLGKSLWAVQQKIEQLGLRDLKDQTADLLGRLLPGNRSESFAA
jgi:hypothetical protein